LFSQLEDLDFADDLALLSTNRSNLQEKTATLDTYAKQTGLKINTAKTQIMYVNTTPTASITASGEPLEFEDDFTYPGSLISKDNEAQKDDFTYLGSLISKDNGAQKDIKARLGKLVVHLPNFIPSGSQISTVLRPSSDCTTAMSNLSCFMLLSAGVS